MRPISLVTVLALVGCQASRSALWQDELCPQRAPCPQVPCHPADGTTPVVFVKAGQPDEAGFYVEVADTLEATTCGLMDRQSLAADWGMLFVFKTEQPRAFWMYRTAISLDLIFADQTGAIVGLAANARPFDATPSYKSDRPARYVLEVNAGNIARLDIRTGQKLAFKGVPGSHPLERLR